MTPTPTLIERAEAWWNDAQTHPPRYGLECLELFRDMLAALKSRPTLDVEGVARIIEGAIADAMNGDWELARDLTASKILALLHSTDGWRDIECMRLINALRADEGDDVTILCDNPDFNGQPNCAVECFGGWTRFGDRRFTGATLLDALSAAWIERQRPPPHSEGGKL